MQFRHDKEPCYFEESLIFAAFLHVLAFILISILPFHASREFVNPKLVKSEALSVEIVFKEESDQQNEPLQVSEGGANGGGVSESPSHGLVDSKEPAKSKIVGYDEFKKNMAKLAAEQSEAQARAKQKEVDDLIEYQRRVQKEVDDETSRRVEKIQVQEKKELQARLQRQVTAEREEENRKAIVADSLKRAREAAEVAKYSRGGNSNGNGFGVGNGNGNGNGNGGNLTSSNSSGPTFPTGVTEYRTVTSFRCNTYYRSEVVVNGVTYGEVGCR